MQPTDIITLQAFLNALSQLNQPLPADVQKQLNQFGASLTANSTNIDEQLETIAENYQPLNDAYKQAYRSLIVVGAERSKGINNLPPEEEPNQHTPEILNTARDVFNDSNSVEAAKKSTKSKNIFERLGNLFNKS
ncbi:hypothetical protein AMR41_03905 [Hapalosiphon sp. MRB220]|nr:hypothetical protein AMR41_03905 [Hapalosiphon sp. MRB220]